MSHVRIAIDQFGRPSAKAIGFVGEACKIPMSNVAAVLGGEAETETKDTEEMYHIETETTEETETYGY